MFPLVSLSLLLFGASGQLNAAQTGNIPDIASKYFSDDVTRCCTGYYNVLFDSCQDEHDLPDEIYVKSNQILTSCPEGYIRQISTDFPLHRNHMEGFCIARFLSPEGDPQFVSRFCVADPWKETNVIRKCCPQGMAIGNKSCDSHAEELTPAKLSESGAVLNVTGMQVVAGVGVPACQFGIHLLRPMIDPYDEFSILPSGVISVAYHSHDHPIEYCVDSFVLDNMTDIVAVICASEIDEEFQVYPYMMLVSAAFLVATFVVYACIRELHNLHGIIVMCYSISLAVMFISLAIIKLATYVMDSNSCVISAVVCHFSFISTFAWLNVMSFNTWWTFSDTVPSLKRSSKRRCLVYSVYGWGVPFSIVTLGRIMDSLETGIRPRFGEARCWFGDNASLSVYLYGPVGTLLAMNLVLFARVMVKMCRAASSPALIRIDARRKIYVVFSLVVLTGVTWIMEIISFAAGGHKSIWLASDLLNISTGIFIFVIFVCNKHVWLLIRGRRDTSDPTEVALTDQHPTFVNSTRDFPDSLSSY